MNEDGTIALGPIIALEGAVGRVLAMVRAATYGHRAGSKRLGDLTLKGGNLINAARSSKDELRKLLASFENVEEDLTETSVLAISAHFAEFLRLTLKLEGAATLPDSVAGLEGLIGVAGALKKVREEFPLFLLIAASSLRGGGLERKALEGYGSDEVELTFKSGKTLLYREGDRIALTGDQLEHLGKAVVEAAKIIVNALSAR